jgi:hypothetical protein
MDDRAIPEVDCVQTMPQSRFDALLESVRAQGGARFDSAGWHYVDSLARRAAAHEGSVRRMLEVKLEQALDAFAERFAHARAGAAELVAATGATHPQAGTELQRLFERGDFKGLRHLQATLEAREQCAALTGLVSQLETAVTEVPLQPSAPHATSRSIATTTVPLELKTVRESRATWARMSVDKQLAQAMKQAPINAGPINSHMLLLRSLAMMQDLSPDYLSRMVSYVDTLLLLDPGEKEVPVKRKSAPAAKAAKATKVKKK